MQVTYLRGCQILVPRSAALVSSGNLLEMLILGQYPTCPESETLRTGKLPGVLASLRGTVRPTQTYGPLV